MREPPGPAGARRPVALAMARACRAVVGGVLVMGRRQGDEEQTGAVVVVGHEADGGVDRGVPAVPGRPGRFPVPVVHHRPAGIRGELQAVRGEPPDHYERLYPHDYEGPHFDWPDCNRVT
ncbi:hypothetical protein C5F59_036275 [Streptomyces sp. QL37]|uniref:hypothetical protein n=1 Tax=Streptomyces sp. QL37 TaxID=2093747 RepID=UPI0021CB8AE9|nr:hypothetical protein [Streptomyces sp. QL37]